MAGGTNFDLLGEGGVCQASLLKKWLVFFCQKLLVRSEVLSSFHTQGEGIKLHLLEGQLPNNLGTYVQNNTLINKQFKRMFWFYWQTIFFKRFLTLVSSFISAFSLQQLLHCCSHGDFLYLSFLLCLCIGLSLWAMWVSSPHSSIHLCYICLCQCELTGTYFIILISGLSSFILLLQFFHFGHF